MKYRILTAILLLLGGWNLFYVQGQNNLTIKLSNGAQQVYELSAIRKITFSDNNLVVNTTDDNQNPFALSSINSILLNASNTDIESTPENETSSLSIYPNPASEVIYINTEIYKETDIYIYRIDGSLVLYSRLSLSANSIDVSGLSPGVYIVKTNNQALKFVKL